MRLNRISLAIAALVFVLPEPSKDSFLLCRPLHAENTTPSSNWSLVGTVQGKESAKSALLEDSSTHKQEIYVVGERVPNLGTLVGVTVNSASFLNSKGSNIATLYLYGGSAGKVQSQSNRIKPSDALELPAKEYLQYRWEKDGKSIFGNSRQFVVKGHEGTTKGVAFVNIEPNTLLHRIGMEDGDMLTSINGTPVHKTGDVYLSLIHEHGVAAEISFEHRGVQRVMQISLK